MWEGRGGEGGGGGSWNPTGKPERSSGVRADEAALLWLLMEEAEGEGSSVLRLVTGVVLLGGMGGEGLAGTRLWPPVIWWISAVGGGQGN